MSGNICAFTSEQSKAYRESTVAVDKNISTIVVAYMKENDVRWCAREYTRINNALTFLPNAHISRQKAIELKQFILAIKTASTFNRYLKYFNALYRRAIANNALLTINPFEGLKVVEARSSIADKRSAYTVEQMKVLFTFAEG